ncbi:hypothetical protein JKF63_01203 [Porcisia hertigi]|uniref:G8 domain-containing protein n=1 Tax=Porcisia hertigi TaxID=2761500 RepID=A0A836HJB4_9TRYP|nr:hypothetical protein JKF63_01203 [Porcisia hertigi]
MTSNLSFLWSVGEVTGDLATTTVVRSVEAESESYGLNVVLPSLSHAVHTVTMPATYNVVPNNGVRFVNQDCMYTRWYHNLYIRGAYPRSTLVHNEDMMATLRPLRLPKLDSVSNPYYTSMDNSLSECQVSGSDEDADMLFCRASMTSVPYNSADVSNLQKTNPMDTCGGGVVIGIYTARNMTPAKAANAVVNWGDWEIDKGVTKVVGFPVTLAVNSFFRLPTVLEAAPEGLQSLRESAAAAPSPSPGNGDWVILRFSFIYQSVLGGIFFVHCDGSAADMQLRIRTESHHDTVVRAHCQRSASPASPFRHTILDTPFASERKLYINGSCTFPLAVLGDADAMNAAFCGVSLEAKTVFLPFESWGGSRLPPYAVYEMRTLVMMNSRGARLSLPRAEAAYTVELRVSESTTTPPLASLSLPVLYSDKDCYELPWWVVESGAQNTGAAPAGQRWGGLGYTHQSFIVVADEMDGEHRYCHHFVAFRLPDELGGVNSSSGAGIDVDGAHEVSPLCPGKLTLEIRALSETAPPVLTQRVFCGPRSFFMDPITPLQMRVPLIEVPRLVDLDALIPDTERGYLVYQYCIDVSFYVVNNGFTGAYAQGGPLVYTVVDTENAPSKFCPRVSEVTPNETTTVALRDTVSFHGEDLRYYSANHSQPISGAHFTVHLAAVEMSRCEGLFAVKPTGVFPGLSAHLTSDTTLALRITADAPGGWFNMTMTHGDLGEVFVDCGLSIRIKSRITSLKPSDVVTPVGGTVIRMRGVNLPMWGGTDVTLTIGYAAPNSSRIPPNCRVTFSLATLMEFVTPNISAERIPGLAIRHTEDTNSDLYWLPVNLTTYYTDIHDRRRVFQSLNVDTVENGAELLSVVFRVTKMRVTNVWPLTVSCMEEAPTFHIRGAGIVSHSVLLCNINNLNSPDKTVCIVCLPRGFSSVELVCDALTPLSAGRYRVYVSDRALEGDSGFNIASVCRVDTVQPDYIYPYTEGVELSLVGQWFAPWSVPVMTVVAISSGVMQTYVVKIVEFTTAKISCLAPDLSWMDEKGGTLSLEVAYAGGTLGCDLRCAVRRVRVLSKVQMPRIESFTPYTGQAPLWITIYGSGFTKLAHSPALPRSVRDIKTGSATAADDSLAAVSEQETYVDVGAGPCLIVDMLNTRILCNLKDPCANLQAYASLRLVSRGHGTTSTVSENSRSLFFNCEMRVTGVSRAVGSIAGGQELNITGIGFPPDPAQVTVTVAETECHVMAASTTRITCTTAMSAETMWSRSGPVQVYNRANARQSTCCFYTFSADITPTLTSVSPTTAAGGARLLLFGTNFPYTDAPGEGDSGIHYTHGGMMMASRQPSANAAMLVLFGSRRLVVTNIESSTRASVTVPHDYFGCDYLSIHVPGVGNSPRFTESLFTVLMMPAVTIPSAGGYRGRVSMRLVGTSLGSNRSAGQVEELFRVYVCGRQCDIQRTSGTGELVCRTPWYMDEELVKLYRGSLTFSKLLDGFTVHARGSPTSSDSTDPSRAAEASVNTLYDGWGDATALFTGAASSTHAHATITSVVNIVASSLFLVLEAHLHSRLLLYSVSLTFAPTTPRANALDLSNARCRVKLATPQAEAATLFSADANPLNASMWRSENSDGAPDARYMWPRLQLGTNTLHFALLEHLPTAAYVGIECEGMPVNTLQIQEAAVAGYQVGLHPAGGNCPVNIRTQQRVDQPIMNSCPSRVGASCPLFQYRLSLTPVVTRYHPVAALTSDIGARITLYGIGFGNDLGAVAAVVLDKAACTPLSVADTELVCSMEGRVSSPQAWQVRWSDESRRGEAMLLSAQPFYAAVLWSSYLAWMGAGLPKEGNIVVLEGNTVMLDITPPPLSGILLGGVLIISDDVDVELRLGYLAITGTGALIAGSAIQPHHHRFTITLALNMFQHDPLHYRDDILSLHEETAQMDEPSYSKMLNVYGGTLQLHGAPPNVSRARLAHPANVGDTSVTVDQWVPWAEGDTIAIVTKHDPDPTHMEQRVIVGREAKVSHTVLFFESNAPLRYSHDVHVQLGTEPKTGSGGRSNHGNGRRLSGWEENWNSVYTASTGTEVVYLSRTIVIRGDEISPLSEVGASVWLRNTTSSYLEHVELYRTGKRGTRKGYSLWLDSLSFPANQVVLKDVVMHDAYYRGVVLEATRRTVVSELTVLYADGYGVAAIGATHERLTVTDSFLFGLYGNSGGLDTVAAGLYASSADVILQNTEICVSEGHGAWYALRFFFVAAQAPTCPAQNRLGAIRGNSLHHVRGHGLFVFPLQFNMADRCQLTANIAVANDPEQVSAAAMAAAATPMKCAGEVSDQLIFSCGLYGVYLPPSSGYAVRHSAIVDCGAASFFLDYITNITEVVDTFLAGVLPDSSCTSHTALGALSSSEGDDKRKPHERRSDRVRCREKNRSAIEARHGGHLFLASIIVGDFMDGTALQLAILATPSSKATSYPAGSYAARRSGHLTLRFFNFSAVDGAYLRLLLAGRVALHDVDGRMSQLNKTTIFLHSHDMVAETAPMYCVHVPSAQSRGLPWSGLLPVETAKGHGRVVWAQGRGRKHTPAGGRTEIELSTALSGGDGGGEDSAKVLHSSRDRSDANFTREELWMCTAPSKQLSLLFVEVASASASSEDKHQPLCHSVAVELREGDNSPTNLLMNLTASAGGAAVSATSFYLLTRDDFPPNGEDAESRRAPKSRASPVWHPPITDMAGNAISTAAGAGFYTLESSTKLLLTFRTASGSLCYPTELSIKVDTSLPWPTAEMLLQVRVSPNTLYLQPRPGTQTLCLAPPLMGEVRWQAGEVRDSDDNSGESPAAPLAPHRASSSAGQAVPPHAEPVGSRPGKKTARVLATPPATESITTWLSLALNPLCDGSVIRVNNSGLWSSSPLLWADVQLAMCEKVGAETTGCAGPHFPYLRAFTKEDPSDRFAPHTSWYSLAAWEGGRAPWGHDDGEEDEPSGEQAVFVIPYGTRVQLHLERAVRVPGVLLVVGELLVTVAPAATACTSSSSLSEGTTPPLVTLSMGTLIVVGKLNVSAPDAIAPTLRIALGAKGASSAPYQLDAETRVYPGTFYAAGEVTLAGLTDAPTVWRATSAARAHTTALPALASSADMSRLQDYCTRLVRLEAGAAVPTVASLRAAVDKCVTASSLHLPLWMHSQAVSGDALVGLRNGSRIAVTSGSSRMNDAEVNTVTVNAMGRRFVELGKNEQSSRIRVVVATPRLAATASVATAWSHKHGEVYAHDESPRLGTEGIYSEVVGLSKTIELECDAPQKSSESGCMLLVTRQRHPVGLFPAPRFRASGVKIRHFGKRAQGEAPSMAVVAPLTFLPALYVNVSTAVSGDDSVHYRTSKQSWSAAGYAVLAGCVIEDSYATALYTDRRNTHLFMVDSAVWNSDGGGVRLDGSGIGVFMIDVVVAGTRYARGAYFGGTSDRPEPVGLQSARWGETMPLTLNDTRVSSLCSVLLNHSHSSRPSPLISGETKARLTAAMVAPFMKNVVAAGSESEGFCVPWDGSGGPGGMANNTAHSSFIGLFLFRATASMAEAGVVTLGGSATAQRGKGSSATSTRKHHDGHASHIDVGAQATPSVHHSFVADPFRNSINAEPANSDPGDAATCFARWTLYGNRFLGVFSSGHQNITITDSDIFANPIGVALAVYPGALSGSSRIFSSYIATFPGCSATATALTAVQEWDVCQFSAYAKPSWTPRGCGPITFVDQSYHYAAVLALPSYEYVPLSYSRRKPVTVPSGPLLEAATNGQLELENILFGGVGELTRCANTAWSNTENPSSFSLLSAAVMGAGSDYTRSSASLGSITLSQVQYASSCAPALASSARSAESDASPSLPPRARLTTSVLRLRPKAARRFAPRVWQPSPGDRLDHSEGPNRAIMYAVKGDSKPDNRSGIDSTPVDIVARQALQANDENPYGMTVVYDMDGSAYHQLADSRCYVARSASKHSSAAAILGSICIVSPWTQGDFFVCPITASFHQVRLQSLDARKVLASLIGRVSLTISRASTPETAAQDVLGSTVAMTILRADGPLRGPDTDTIRHALSDTSAAQIAFQVPLGTAVSIVVEPDAYPEALQVALSACTAPTPGSQAVTLLRLPLMDEDITLHVWSARSRTQLAPASGVRSFSMNTDTTSTTAAGIDPPLASHIPTANAPLPPGEATRWFRYTDESGTAGTPGSALLLQVKCGAHLRIHQLVYGTVMLYAPEHHDIVTQRLLQAGPSMTVRQLVPPDLYPDSQLEPYMTRLRITTMSTYPDPSLDVGTWLTLKVEAVDHIDYNTSAATAVIDSFLDLIGADTSFYATHIASTAAVPLATSRRALQGRLRRVKLSVHPTEAAAGGTDSRRTIKWAWSGGEWHSSDKETTASGNPFLMVGGLRFGVLLTMPVLLPSERAQLKAILQTDLSTVRPGWGAKVSLVVFVTAVAVILLLLFVYAALRAALPSLKFWADNTAEPRRCAGMSMGISAGNSALGSASATSLGRDKAAVPPMSGSSTFAEPAVVWMAGILRTVLVATLDKCGVTRSGEQVRARPNHPVPVSFLTRLLPFGNLAKPKGSGASKTVTRQLFLLPDYNVLGAGSSCRTGRSGMTTVPPVGLKRSATARLSDPHRTYAGERQRYANQWRIAHQAMRALTQRSVADRTITSLVVRKSTPAKSPAHGADAVSPGSPANSRCTAESLSAPATVRPAPLITPLHCDGGGAFGHQTTATANHRFEGGSSWQRSTPGASSGSGSARSGGTEAVLEEGSGRDTMSRPPDPECIIPVRFPPLPPSPSPHISPSLQDRTAPGGLASHQSLYLRPHPLGSDVHSTGPPGGLCASSFNSSDPAATQTAETPLHPPVVMPVALQSILRTSLLSGNATRSSCHTDASAISATPANIFARTPPLVQTPGLPESTHQVLRGRGQILFTTPSVDSPTRGAPQRALRFGMNVTLSPRHQVDYHDENAAFEKSG